MNKAKIEYGDFQTPPELAEKVCCKLVELGLAPSVIIEPTCGLGAFVEASARLFPSAERIVGIEINPAYLAEFGSRQWIAQDKRIKLVQGDFFRFDWVPLVASLEGQILIVGNFPWVTNSRQGMTGSSNLPEKTNFQNHNGFDAITGKSNFDISEWMLIQACEWMRNRSGYLAMLCKTSVARKLLNHLHSQKRDLAYSAIYEIDAKKYFGASVDACLFLCKFTPGIYDYSCDVFDNLESKDYHRIGYRNGLVVRDLDSFESVSNLYCSNRVKWRSGVKHDCSVVMELRKIGGALVNGLDEEVDIEPTFLFPLLKGSDVANGRTASTNRYVLVTQKFVGEITASIQHVAPKTWRYLERHASYLDSRKSRIYHGKPRFSVFGVGPYTFAAWKIAICGLYKKLAFRLVGKIDDKPVVFDDTVYFLAFGDEKSAINTLGLLSSPPATKFLSSLIFWDEKRPITTNILGSLNLGELEKASASNASRFDCPQVTLAQQHLF